jgi:hypothetical protein
MLDGSCSRNVFVQHFDTVPLQDMLQHVVVRFFLDLHRFVHIRDLDKGLWGRFPPLTLPSASHSDMTLWSIRFGGALQQTFEDSFATSMSFDNLLELAIRIVIFLRFMVRVNFCR